MRNCIFYNKIILKYIKYYSILTDNSLFSLMKIITINISVLYQISLDDNMT